jgi:hypothetical protein
MKKDTLENFFKTSTFLGMTVISSRKITNNLGGIGTSL